MRRSICTLLLALVYTSACSSSGTSPSSVPSTSGTPTPVTTPTLPAAPTLTSVAISGGDEIIGRNQKISLQAKATYSDNSTKDVTADATWSSSNPPVAVVDKGQVTSVGYGQTDIQATYQSKSSTLLRLKVSNPPAVLLTAISVGLCGKGEFQRNGVAFYSKPGCALNAGRGFNVAVIDGNGNTEDLANFDTWYDLWGGLTGASAALVTFINSQPSNKLIMIAVGDEAGLNLGPGCDLNSKQEAILKAVESLGGRQIRSYCYWDSYVLIGSKSGGAQAEQLVHRGQASASYSLAPP